eukprot:scaffold35760_cov55-Phaeocystis_antarctica.AAC.4
MYRDGAAHRLMLTWAASRTHQSATTWGRWPKMKETVRNERERREGATAASLDRARPPTSNGRRE